MKVVNLRRRETVKLKPWILPAERAQKIFIPLDTKIRMQPTLHQHAGAAQRNGLVDFRANLIDGSDVSVRRAGPPIESTKGADYIADIRVINVAIDDIGDDVVGMTALPNFICCRSYAGDVVGFE